VVALVLLQLGFLVVQYPVMQHVLGCISRLLLMRQQQVQQACRAYLAG
jgi:hypothetical protein